MITKAQLLGAARASVAANHERPATQAVMAAVAAELEGSPAWWPAVERAWAGRAFPDADQALALLWAAMHYSALNGHPLGRHLPTCGGVLSSSIGEAVRGFLADPPEGFTLSLHRRRKAYSPFFSGQWLEVAALFFQRRRLPYYVVELDSAGGLGACADLIAPRQDFDSTLVDVRVGLSEPPLDARRDEDAKWLIAAWMPDDIQDVGVTATALRLVRQALASDPTAVQTAACPPASYGAFLAEHVPAAADHGLLLTSCELLRHLPQAQRDACVAGLARALGPWEDRALWVDSSAAADDPFLLHVTVLRNGRRGGRSPLESRVYKTVAVRRDSARVDADAAANAAFLS